jgi:MFS family permease
MARTPARAGSLISRFIGIGALSAGVVGGVVGLVVGLHVNPRTAWFAVFELGIPAAVVGGLLGLWFGTLVSAGRWLDRRARRAHERSDLTP